MAEIECPNCNEHLVFPQGEPDVFECPECVADLNWDGSHIIGVKTNRKYLFAAGENFNSYFDPEFYTKLLLETIPQNNSFGIGKYVVGLTSGAYGVVEGAPSGTYSIGNILFVKTLC